MAINGLFGQPRDPRDAPAMRRDLVVVFTAALLLRLIYFAQYAAELPFLYGPIADSVVYLEQSFRVRHGELGAAVLLAFSPLYGYFLALFGGSVLAPVLVQLVFGCVTACVLYALAFQWADRVAARFTAALFLSYGTLLYYESKILSETLSLLLGSLALYWFVGAGARSGRVRVSVLSGVLFALSILARASLVFSAPLIVIAAALPWQSPRESVRVLLQRAGGVALGLALVLGGNGTLNYAASGLFVPVILVSRTVEASSGAAFDGQLSSIKFGEGLASSYDVVENAKRRLEEVQNNIEPPASSAARIDLGGWLAHAPGKLLKTLSPREITFQYGYNGERDHVSVLRWLPASFGVLLLWGLIGVVAVAIERGWRALLPFAPIVLGVLITTTLYHPSTRYRLALVLPLLVLGGVGFASLLRLPSLRRAWLSGVAAFATVALVVLHVQASGYNRAEFALQRAMSSGIQGDLQAQVRYAQDAVGFAPNDPSVRERANGLIRDAQSRQPH